MTDYKVGMKVVALEACYDSDIFDEGDIGTVTMVASRDVRVLWPKSNYEWWTELDEMKPIHFTIGNTKFQTEGARV